MSSNSKNARSKKSTAQPYRVYLSATLHRRFLRAAFFALLICYVEAILIGEKKSWFWCWFPLGVTGFRTLLLFIASLLVFILRVAQAHVGARNTESKLETFKKFSIRLNTIQTLGWYFLSAWIFCEVYIWSASGANLAWVIPGNTSSRARLNERPIYLRSVYFILAFAQSCWHLYLDQDRIPLPVTNRVPEALSEQGTHVVQSPLVQMKAKIVPLVISASTRAVGLGFACPFIYALLVRAFAWKWTVFFAKLFWGLPRSQSEPVGPGPWHIFLILQSISSGFLLIFLWDSSNLLFTVFAVEEPLKLAKPLTDPSKDPNGSLLTGLQSKRELTRTFAFWELMLISQRFKDRRKTIFDGLEREGGSTWSQILEASLGLVNAMTARVELFEGVESPSVTDPDEVIELETLPQLSKPPKEDNIFAKPPKAKTRTEWVGKRAGKIAKSYGSAPDWTPQARQKAKAAIGKSVDWAVPDKMQQKVTPDYAKTTFHHYISQALRSPVGIPFRKTFSRRVSCIVLGGPHSELSPIVDAIDSITRLLVCSLKEDTFGKVQEDVPLVVNTFTTAIQSIRRLVATTPPHWTDVYFDEQRKVDDVEVVLCCLRDRLGDLLGAFSLYLETVGIVGEELEEARRSASSGTEMMETGR